MNKDFTIKLLHLGICFLALAVSLVAQDISCVSGEIAWKEFTPSPGMKDAEYGYCRELKQNPNLQAIYGFSLDTTHGQLVRVFKDRAIYTRYESARFSELELNKEEFAAFQRTVNKVDFDKQVPLLMHSRCTDMCSLYQFLHITGDGGKRIPILAPYSYAPAPLDSVSKLFSKWDTDGAIRTRYYLSEKYPGAKLLITNGRYSVRSVWKARDDIRILIVDREAEPQAAFTWRTLSAEKLGGTVERPASFSIFGDYSRSPCGRLMIVNHSNFEQRLGDSELCVGVAEIAGLWKVGADKAIRITIGEYSSPIVTRDQKWIISSKGDSDKPIWKSIVRINTTTNHETRVEIPKSDCLYPASSVPLQDLVLVVRCKADYTAKEYNPSPDPPEYYLLDPETGKVSRTYGEIRPILQQRDRYLQPSGQANEFWAAIPNKTKSSTEIGRFDPRKLVFVPVMSIPSIVFYSYEMWVDETGRFVYLVYEGDLLRIPLEYEKG